MTDSQEETSTDLQRLFTAETSPGLSVSQAFLLKTRVIFFCLEQRFFWVTFRQGTRPDNVHRGWCKCRGEVGGSPIRKRLDWQTRTPQLTSWMVLLFHLIRVWGVSLLLKQHVTNWVNKGSRHVVQVSADVSEYWTNAPYSWRRSFQECPCLEPKRLWPFLSAQKTWKLTLLWSLPACSLRDLTANVFYAGQEIP